MSIFQHTVQQSGDPNWRSQQAGHKMHVRCYNCSFFVLDAKFTRSCANTQHDNEYDNLVYILPNVTHIVQLHETIETTLAIVQTNQKSIASVYDYNTLFWIRQLLHHKQPRTLNHRVLTLDDSSWNFASTLHSALTCEAMKPTRLSIDNHKMPQMNESSLCRTSWTRANYKWSLYNIHHIVIAHVETS